MEKRNNPLKNSRILYLSVVAVLCVTAIIIGIVAASGRAKPQQGGSTNPPDNGKVEEPSGNGGADAKPEDKPSEAKPTYLSPLSGVVCAKHDTDTLVVSPTMNDWRIHTGIDIAASAGDAVCASADGTVKEIWEDVMMGTCVSIDHGDGVISIYSNLAEELPAGLAAGKSVKAGDTIGAVGESALSELAGEPHLHFEMTKNGAQVDPLSLLSAESVSASLTFDEEVFED